MAGWPRGDLASYRLAFQGYPRPGDHDTSTSRHTPSHFVWHGIYPLISSTFIATLQQPLCSATMARGISEKIVDKKFRVFYFQSWSKAENTLEKCQLHTRGLTMKETPSAEIESEETQVMRLILRALREIRYGSIQIVIQDSKVVQIEKLEKIRLV